MRIFKNSLAFFIVLLFNTILFAQKGGGHSSGGHSGFVHGGGHSSGGSTTTLGGHLGYVTDN